MAVIQLPSVTGAATRQGEMAMPIGAKRLTVITSDEDFGVNTLAVLAEQSFDGGVTWRHLVSASIKPTPEALHPSVSVSIDDARTPTHLRVTLDPTGIVRFGATLTAV